MAATQTLTWAEIEEVFKSWQKQAQSEEKTLELWTALYEDLRMKAGA